MTLALSTSLDRAAPTPQGSWGAAGNKPASVRYLRGRYIAALRDVAPEKTEAELRRRLLAAGEQRIPLVEGKLRELWEKLTTGWRECGWTILFRNERSGTVLGLPRHCDRNLCGWCEPRGLAKLRDRYRPRVAAAAADRRLFYAVLTVPNPGMGDLAATIGRLTVAVAKLRRRRAWQHAAIAGGLWRLEVTINLSERTWHPHLNLLFEVHPGACLNMRAFQPALQREWRAVLGESAGQWVWLRAAGQVDIVEAVKRRAQLRRAGENEPEEEAVERALGYVIKPDPHWIDPSDPAWVWEYCEALDGCRTLNTFGTWRKTPEPDPEPDGEELVDAPYVPGDDPWAVHKLPALDPLTDEPAEWKWIGGGPRYLLRPFRPPGDGRRAWLVWHPDVGGPDPETADEPVLRYQSAFGLGP